MAREIARERPPDEVALKGIQAKHLARLTGMPADDLAAKTVRELASALRWRVNPDWFLFEQVCGQVVKVDPVSGLSYPVPGATVNFIDRDCDWLWHFPLDWPWGWIFPWGFCEDETIATTTTDACGNFCVWIPRFEIEWILTWRRERVCFPWIFRRPSIGDLLRHIGQEAANDHPVNPNPPDPAPLVSLLGDRQDVITAIGSGTAARLQTGTGANVVGASRDVSKRLMASPAFTESVPPPLHRELRRVHQKGDHRAVAELLNIDQERAAKLDLSRWYGPFLRCFDVFFPEWYPVFEVPDITIEVTQDTDGDGDQEIIYDQAFGAPWAIPTPELVLDAAQFALALPSPGCGPAFPCSDTPAVQTIGVMPVDPGYVEGIHGFATRPNPARSSGDQTVPPATYPSTAPFASTLLLYGCVHIGSSTHYRILSEFAPGDGLSGAPSFGAALPLTEHWPMYHFGPFIERVQQPINSEGWYPILDDSWSPAHLIMNWNPIAMGSYRLTLETGTMASGVVTVDATAPAVVFFVDNSYPVVSWNTLQWRYHGDISWTTLDPLHCPLIVRDPSRAIEVQVGVGVVANHLRSVVINAGGCGGAPPSPTSVDHWYTDEFDNSCTDNTIYTIPAHAQAGCYGWTVTASSRAFNPDGFDNGLAIDWLYDPQFRYVTPSISVAIVNA